MEYNYSSIRNDKYPQENLIHITNKANSEFFKNASYYIIHAHLCAYWLFNCRNNCTGQRIVSKIVYSPCNSRGGGGGGGEVMGLRPQVFLYQEMKIIVQKKYPKNLQLNQFQNSSNNQKKL